MQGAPAIFNAANEVAVAAFLNGQIGFLDIAACVSDSLERGEKDGVASVEPSDFETVLEVDRQGRRLATDAVGQRSR